MANTLHGDTTMTATTTKLITIKVTSEELAMLEKATRYMTRVVKSVEKETAYADLAAKMADAIEQTVERVTEMVECRTCKGDGAADHYGRGLCRGCNGAGEVERVVR